MKVLVGCEESDTVRSAFEALGHDAWSCDILPSRNANNKKHLRCDIRDVIGGNWDIMIAHPPCTFLANSGVRWLYCKDGSPDINRWVEMGHAANLFRALLDANIPLISVENPIQHFHAREMISKEYDQIIQPWQFGHGETKATCLWLKDLPPLIPTNIVDGREHRIHKMPGSKNQAKNRSVTYSGIAAAMAQQWGNL